MADFNELWDADNPSDSTAANEIDDYENNLRAMIEERVADMLHGFTSGEDTDAPGFKKVTLKQQAAAPGTPNADEVVLYAIDDGTNCGVYAKNEDGYATQILKKIGSTFMIADGAYGADSIDEDDIRLTNDGDLTGRNNADDGDVNILKVNTSDEVEFGADLALGSTDGTDGQEITDIKDPSGNYSAANKKYVDTKEAIISTQATAGLFGTRTQNDTTPAALAKDTVYQAACDGFLTVTHDHSSESAIVCYSDSSNPPTTVLGQYATTGVADKKFTITVPVKKSDYVKTTATGDAPDFYWMPYGTGGLVDQTP